MDIALEPKTEVLHFTDSFEHALDGSNRIMVPSRWRPVDKEVLFSLIPWPVGEDEYILGLTPARWQKMLERLGQHSLSNPQAASVKRYIGSTTVQLKIDSAGRFCLTEKLLQSVGISNRATFVGRMEEFELWEPSRLKAKVAGDKSLAAQVAKELML